MSEVQGSSAYERILVAVDGSEHAQRALEHAVQLVKSLKADSRLTVLHVNPVMMVAEPPLGVDVDERLDEEGHAVTEPYRTYLNTTGVQYEVRYHTGDPATVICDAANDEKMDLVIMGTSGKSAVSELFLGSVSHKVIQHAECPVMTVK
ncbi:universal stress protein [Paenibacillus bovis]|uniref:Universal stress protein UspA n=1 Tax=Paenibacillus bovis TaxID=1616788 RepID=A0A172ZCP6_9BACL|nr:universal stress protein [Paenibacillus bovis]ANF95388.1 universal stress protein UspA [Paenibacillus bovis]